MKKLVLILASLFTLGANAQQAPSEGLMACVNQEFIGMAQQAIQGLFAEQVAQEMANATTPEQQQAVAQKIRPLMNEMLLAMIEPYSTQTAGQNGEMIVNVTDEDIIAAYAPICNTLGDIGATGLPKLDKESPIYAILLKERKELEVKIQPKMDEIAEIEKTIAELTQKIADIQNGISTELDKINEIDTFVQEKLVVPGKPAEQVQAEIAEALQSPEVIEMMEGLTDILEAKFSESTGEEIELALSGEPAPQPAPATQEPVSEEFVPDFKN